MKAWPPANMTGGIAGFGRYGMVAPLGGDWIKGRNKDYRGRMKVHKTGVAVDENNVYAPPETARKR